MLSEGWNNEVFSPRSEGDNPNAPVFRALHPAHQALREETVHGDADRTRGQIDDWADCIDGQRPLMEQNFQHPEIRVAEAGILYTRSRVARQRAHRLQHYKPNVRRLLNTVG